MEAVVLAGGFGTRLRQLVADVPKPMAPIAGHPFLEILLSSLATKKFDRIILSLGFQAEKVFSHFGNKYKGMDLVYEIESSPLGTGGAVRAALQHCYEDHTYIFNGDTFIDLEISQVEASWQQHCGTIIVAREVPDTSRFGRLDIVNGRVIGFKEKGLTGPGVINAGCYVLPRGCLSDYDVGKRFSFEADFFTSFVGRENVNVFITNGHFIDIGVPEDYFRAQTELAPYIQ